MAGNDVEGLKVVGNQYITSKPPEYEKAVEVYSKALSIDPNHHAILSNRSLAYYKLGKYENALTDAEKATCVSPKWAKGYLRKCAALNALKRNEEAKRVAENGFQLMHSTPLLRDFVSQWLVACEFLYAIEKLPSLLPYGEAQLCRVMIGHWMRFRKEHAIGKDVGFLPNSLVILSKKYWQVLFRCLASRASPELAITHKLMQEYLSCVAEEFNTIISPFGQKPGDVVKEWVKAITTHVEPTTLEALFAIAAKESSQLAHFLEADVHTTLYPVARSLLVLVVTVVTTRVYVLNSASTGFDSVKYVLQACLFLFESSILNTREYTGLHLKVLTGLVDAYNRRYKPLSLPECTYLTVHCKKIESLLPGYATSCTWEYQQFRDTYEHIVATAKGLVLARETGTAIPFQRVPDEPLEMTTASALRDVGKQPTQVKSYAVKRLQEVTNKPPRMVTLSDGQDLLHLTAVFLKLDDFESAKNALTTGEKIVVSLVGVQLQLGTLTLEDAPSTIGTLRQDVLMNGMLFKDLDARLVTDMLIRWKGLFSEFRAVAMSEGLGKVYLSTAASHRNLQTSGKDRTGVHFAEEHKRKEDEFMKQNAFRCWSAVVECPRLLPVEKVLEPDELIVEFVRVGKYDEENLRAFLQLCILTILPNGERELAFVDSTKCDQLVKEWLQHWNVCAAEGSSPEAVRKLEEAGKNLSPVLFPPSVQRKIKQPLVKHVYLGLEVFGALPIHMLPDEDGFLLFSDCTTSYINACRELIREFVSHYLAHEKTSSQGGGDVKENGSVTTAVTASEESKASQLTASQSCASGTQAASDDSKAQLTASQSCTSKPCPTINNTQAASEESKTQLTTSQSCAFEPCPTTDGTQAASEGSKAQLTASQSCASEPCPTTGTQAASEKSKASQLTASQFATSESCPTTDGTQGSPHSPKTIGIATVGGAQPTETLPILTSNCDCYIFAEPNYDLKLLEPGGGNTSVLKQFLDMVAEKLLVTEIPRCEPLPSSLSEAHAITEIIHNTHSELNVHIKSGDAATLDTVLQLQSPLLVHFCTHAFATPGMGVSQPGYVEDAKAGLVLAGFNTYRAQKFEYIDPKASTGILTPFATYGLNLSNTRLVFLSTCVSAVGTSVLLESGNSLANAFRAAGALTVIATMWKIPDDSATQFVRLFYNKLLQPGVRPSEALEVAREDLRKDPRYSCLQDWAGFACYGDDIPLFPN